MRLCHFAALLLLVAADPRSLPAQTAGPDLAATRLKDDLSPASLFAALLESKRVLQSAAGRRENGANAGAIKDTIADFENFLNKEGGFTENFYQHLLKNYEFRENSFGDIELTGYYEPLLRGSLKKSCAFKYPIYGPPADLSDGRVYLSRGEIDFGASFEDRAPALLWVDDPVDLFFLHVQGSGAVTLESGKSVRVGFAAANNLPYRPIGELLVNEGLLPRHSVSMQSIRSYLQQHPSDIRRVLSYNPRYIFFRILKESGPVGSTGAVLTPWRSLAADPACFPPGALALLESREPVFNQDGSITGSNRFSRFVLIQDTGAAIKGCGKADLFTGGGEKGALVAGHLKEKGRLFVLVKKNSRS